MNLQNKSVFIGIFGMVAAGAWWSLAPNPSANETQPTPAAKALVGATTGPAAKNCELQSGRVYSWQYQSRDQATIDAAALGFAGADTGGTKVETGLQATLNVKVVSKDADQMLVLARLTDAESDHIHNKKGLERPFLVRIDSDCSIEGFAHESMTSQAFGRIQQAVLHDLDFAMPNGQPFESSDTLGRTVASLSETTADGQQTIVKSLTSLTPWHTGMGGISELTAGELRVVRTQGWFDDMHLQVSGTGTGVTSNRDVVVSTIPANDAAFERLSTNEADYVWTDLLPLDLPLPESDERFATNESVRNREAKKDFNQAFGEFVARIEKDVPIQQTWPDMRNYLEARPEAASELVTKLKNDEMPAQARMATYMALGNAHTPEAKEALEGIMEDENAPAFERVRAILSLIDRPDVGTDLAEYLATNSSSPERSLDKQLFARHSMLALGAMSSRQASKPEVKAVAVRTISSALESTEEVMFLGPVYKAMANVGDASMLPLVHSATDNPDHMIREAAAVVTRRMDPVASAEFSQRWLEKEKDWRVKEVIYMTLENQTFTANKTTSKAVLRLAMQDLKEQPTVITRKSIIRLLARAKKEFGPQDSLSIEIEEAFLDILPYEVQVRSGLYLTIANEISNPIRLREALASLYKTPSASNPPGPTPTVSAPTAPAIGVK